MLIVGLTGSIGMGKSTVAARFRAHGIAVCDADAEVHKLYEGPAVPAIEAAFPGTTDGGRVDRQRLSKVLLDDPAGFKRLEAIVHPMVFAAERAFLNAEAARGAPLTVLEIPLLLESGGEKRGSWHWQMTTSIRWRWPISRWRSGSATWRGSSSSDRCEPSDSS
jgi:dephospho-CoA kinase